MKLLNLHRAGCLPAYALFAFALPACLATPPGQPVEGPGGTQYLHAEAAVYGPYYAEGSGDPDAYLYYTFEPASPKPETAPVVLFLHAQFAYNPQTYNRLILHIVRKGYVVVWARYDSGFEGFDKLPNNAMRTWKDALDRLENDTEEGHVRPARTAQGRLETAFMGHSMGGYISAILAVRTVYPENEMEIPFAVVMFTPGGFGSSPDEHFEDMDSDTALIVAVGESDIAINKENQVAFWNATSHLSPNRRQFLFVQTDRHGMPPLEADHSFPKTDQHNGEEDALDFYGTYKFGVGALNCVFYERACEYAFGDGSSEQTTMGTWSDGVDVKPTIWLEDPSVILGGE